MVKVCIRKALENAKSLFVIRKHNGLELLISYWSIEIHTFIASWGEFRTTLEDVSAIVRLYLFGDHNATGITLEKTRKTLQLLTPAFSKFKNIRQVNLCLVDPVFQLTRGKSNRED